MNIVTRLVGFDKTQKDDGFVVSYSIGVSNEQLESFKRPSYDHFHAFVNGYDFTTIKSEKSDGSFDVLFIDLTPGQVAANMASGGVSSGYWFFNLSQDGQAVPGDAGELSDVHTSNNVAGEKHAQTKEKVEIVYDL